MSYAVLHNHSYNSLLDAISDPKDIAARCKELKIPACALTDHGSISAAIPFLSACKKNDIKGILGIELYICEENPSLKSERELKHLIVLCKNLAGWQDLMELVTECNDPANFYYKPRINLENLEKYGRRGNLLCLDGHFGSCLSYCIFPNPQALRGCDTVECCKTYINKNWVEDCRKHLRCLENIFGTSNVYLEVQLLDRINLPPLELLAQGYRYLAKQDGYKCVASTDAHYIKEEDAILQRIVLANSLGREIKDILNAISRGEDVGLGGFFKSSKYYIPSYEELQSIHTKEELTNTLLIADKCESYDITHKPILPKFPLQNVVAGDYIKELCRGGWRQKIDKIKEVCRIKNITEKDYVARLEAELKVILEYHLEDYFLIVWDIVRYARDNQIQVGFGRGSAAGSLILYLLNVTTVDPLEYDLLFERFLNAGRFTKDRVSLPDVDMDFDIRYRDKIFDYIKEKYGQENVGQICTFGTLKGRAALYDVLRAFNVASSDEIHRITSVIPDPAKISDELQIMKDNGENPSILVWSLRNCKELQPYCTIDAKDKLSGEYAQYFEYAIRLENVRKSQGKHAAGIVIADKPLYNYCPMIYDKSEKQLIAGYNMEDIEKNGLLKLDILGVAALSKLSTIAGLIKNG